MSGIFGLFYSDGAPVSPDDLGRMASVLETRGPEATGVWRAGRVGLGHTLLATSAEAALERLPLRNGATGCVITGDVRLDNRDELLAALRLSSRTATIGDVEIVLTAYLAWGESCVERLLGDFAFAVWDPRRRALLCARDHFGMRPLYYYHSERRLFAFASEPRAILVLAQIPYRINEGRIADFLVNELEGIDKTSSFFDGVYRLPPAHTMTVTADGASQRRYWTLEPGPELRLPSDEAYAEAFLEVFTEAVRCRLRSAGPVGSMLSGGMDSGSVVAVARELFAEQGRGPFPTFSATGPESATCIETRTIHAALTMNGLDPHIVNHRQLDELMPELEELTWNLEEPFDNHMTLPRAIYLAAHRRGFKVLLDGGAGDNVLAEGTHVARLLRRGRWLTAFREVVGQNRFWGSESPILIELSRSAGTAFVPSSIRRLLRSRYFQHDSRESIINPAFAERIHLAERLKALEEHRLAGSSVSYGAETARSIDHPYLTVGRERYGRVAAAVGLEPRDPFLDRRVVALCLTLPGEQRLGGGWPKVVLRRAAAGRMPDAVRWRRGKEHLGFAFTTALMGQTRARIRRVIEANRELLLPYVSHDILRRVSANFFDEIDFEKDEAVYEIAHLAAWIDRHSGRPQAASSMHH